MRRRGIGEVKFFIDRNFLAIALAAAFLIYLIVFPYNSIFPDESSNLLLGKTMLEGRYDVDFIHRMPFIPTIASLMYAAGFSPFLVRFIVPLVFTLLTVFSLFRLVSLITNKKTAMHSVLLLLAFPIFWRWTVRFMQDIPMMSMVALGFYLYYMFLKTGSQRHALLLGLVCGVGMVIKLTFVILPFLLLVHILLKRRDLLKSRNFLYAAVLLVMVALSFYCTAMAMGSNTSLLGTVSGRVTGEEELTIVRVMENDSISYMFKLVLFPVGIFALAGILPFWRKNRLMFTFSILLIAAYLVFWGVRPRYFSAVYLLLMIISAEGFLRLKNTRPKITWLVFSVLLAFSFMNSVHLTLMDTQALFGFEDLVPVVQNLGGKVAIDHLYFYINITSPVADGQLPGNTVSELNAMFFSNDSLERLKASGAEYAILSLYGDYLISGASGTFPVFYGPFNLPINAQFSNGRIPPNYTFSSDLYKRLETDPDIKRIDSLSVGDRELFIIYQML